MNNDLFGHWEYNIFSVWGISHEIFVVNLDTLIYTWISLVCLLCFSYFSTNFIAKSPSHPFSVMIIEGVKGLMHLLEESCGTFQRPHAYMVGTIFLFTFFTSVTGVIPFLDEATKDLNTTLALGLTSFFYVHYHSLCSKGFSHYIKEFFEPFPPFVVLNIVGEIAKVASMSFRLFGNVLGGSIIVSMLFTLIATLKTYYLGYCALLLIVSLILWNTRYRQYILWIPLVDPIIAFFPFVQIIFGVIEAIIQTLVITMLTANYLGMAVSSTSEDGEG